MPHISTRQPIRSFFNELVIYKKTDKNFLNHIVLFNGRFRIKVVLKYGLNASPKMAFKCVYLSFSLSQTLDLQRDWDRMSEYMTDILNEVQLVEEQRRRGKEVATPTPKLHQIITEIRDMMSIKDGAAREMDPHRVAGGAVNGMERDLYAGVSSLFGVRGMERGAAGSGGNHLSVGAPAHAKGLSFGAVDALFADEGPVLFGDDGGDRGDPSSSSSVPHRLLSAGRSQHDDNRKNRLSYGGVESLFAPNIKFVEPTAAEHTLREDHEMEVTGNSLFGHEHERVQAQPPPFDGGAVLAVSFEPTYDGVATLFEDPPPSALSSHSHLKKATIGGDIVEMFIDHAASALPTEIERGIEEEEEVDDREPPFAHDQVPDDAVDSMDEQRNPEDYVYSSSNDGNDRDDEEDDQHLEPPKV